MPPWILLGAMTLLVPLFAFMTVENIHRQKLNSTRMLLEKGAALIRSFEAGTRTGVMGTHWNSFQLQRLLIETAQQPDIAYLHVTDLSGRVVAHSNPALIGGVHVTDLDLKAIIKDPNVTGRIVKPPQGKAIYEVMRRFSPAGPPRSLGPRHDAFFQRFRQLMKRLDIPTADDWVIFVGLDMSTVESARRADTRQTIVMGAVLALIGFAGVVLLFLAQRYRATRQSLSRVQAFSDNIVSHMPIGLIALDSNKTLATVNQAAADLLNLSDADVIGKDARDMLPQQLNDLIAQLDDQQRVVDAQVTCRLTDGRFIPLEINATVLEEPVGFSFGSVLLMKDLTEVQTLQIKVARSRRLATVGRLAAGVAHEIRNPLSSIKGFATYFKERYPDVSEDQKITSVMIQEVDKLNRVVGQLLEFARPVTITKKWCDINVLVEESLLLVKKQAQENDVRIEQQCHPTDLKGFLDRDRMHQVLLNLYLNSLDAMKSGGVLRVEAQNAAKMDGVVIRISDTGTGIAADDTAHIFDPYYTTKPSGTGLGLAIVHNIIEAHQGQITPESQADQGMVMTIFLPSADTSQSEKES